MYNVHQECMTMSLLLGKEEEECVTAKNLKQVKSFTCTKNGTHLCVSSQFHNLQLHNAVLPSCFNKMCERSKLSWQVLAKQEQLLALPDARNFCYGAIHA